MAESLIALRDRREQVIARISDCYASDVIEVDDLERRLDLAHAARTIAELEVIVEDLAPSPSTALVRTPGGSVVVIDDPNRPITKRLRVALGSVERKGRWIVPRTLEVRLFWGSAVLDFRDASLGAGVTTIDVRITMANLEIILPPELAVDVDVSSFAGNVEERHRVPPDHDPDRPLLQLTGAVRFGNLELTTRLPGESRTAAGKRERRERKQLRKQGHHYLPPGSE